MSAMLPRAATVVLVRDGVRGVEMVLMRRPSRGSFAGAWVFPGGKLEPADAAPTEQQAMQNAAIRETAEEVGLTITRDDLQLLSTWEPPEGIPVRILTWFFLAQAPVGDITIQPGEVEEAIWITAAGMLARHAAGDAILYPPTFVTLDVLSGYGSVAELTAAVAGQRPAEHRTHLRDEDGTQVFLWEGDAEYDEPGHSGPRHRIVAGPVPWTYERP